MDIISYNKAVLNERYIYGLVQRGITKKVVVFHLTGMIKPGDQPLNVTFPFNGAMEEITVLCNNPGETDTTIVVQKTSRQNFLASGEWENLYTFSVEGGKKGINLKITPIPIIQGEVLRISIPEVGEGLQDVLVQLIISI